MKRLVVILGGLLALPAFAEVAPFYYEDVTEFADTEMTGDSVASGDEIVAEENAIAAPIVPTRPAARTTANRSVSRATPSSVTTGNRVSNSRVVASRSATGAVTARGTTQRATVARSASAGNVSRAATSNQRLYLPNSTGRVGIRSASSTASTGAISGISVTNTPTVSADSIKTTTETMDNLVELTDYCRAQYTACMDNFCNVLDDNQGRCSCSKNLKNYEKTEEALKAATEELQEVAQRIQYIGLTSKEITTLFSQTEAELQMQNTSDSTKLKNDLERIKNMIVGVKSGSASTIGDTSGISLDLSNLLSFNIDSTGFDLSALFGTTSSNTSSISNQRGEALYKTAVARCKSAVLNQCTSQGVDAAAITNAYDVEIDKQCIAYERALTDSNSQMIATIRNAKTVLQKARLMGAKQKNEYDLRGCISALDSCMQDDYVCGSDYEDCLDPTAKYIVEGKVVVGSMPGTPGGMWADANSNVPGESAVDGLYVVWNNGGNKGAGQNIWSPSSTNQYTMAQYINGTLSSDAAKTLAPRDMSQYLQSKIGYHDNSTGRNHGMCISVLNKCQDQTYDKSGKYLANNSVIAQYMERAFRQIKTAQDEALSSYASSCLSDVTSCLSQNNYSFSSASGNNYSDLAIKACLPIINTCRSVTMGLSEGDILTVSDLKDIYKWLDAGINTSYQTQCVLSGGKWGDVTGNTADLGTMGCICDSAKNMVSNDGNRTCSCKDGYVLINDTDCIERGGKVYNCQTTGGVFTAGYYDSNSVWKPATCDCAAASLAPNSSTGACEKPVTTTLTTEEKTACINSGGSVSGDQTSCVCATANNLVAASDNKTCVCSESAKKWDAQDSACIVAAEKSACNADPSGTWNPSSHNCTCSPGEWKTDAGEGQYTCVQ